MQVGVVGAGINGVCIAWELARMGHGVALFERDTAMAHTSRTSSKLLHGGLRYLENGEFRLVREGLQERRAWFEDAPDLARPIQLILPVFEGARRGKWTIGLGLSIYDLLARGSGLPTHEWLDRGTVIALDPNLDQKGLAGAFRFWDGQMDDCQLGLWVALQAKEEGASLYEGKSVAAVGTDGTIHLENGLTNRYDMVVNAAGPWASKLLQASGISSQHQLDLVRGSHIVLERPVFAAYFLEVPGERRIFFVLPWQGGTLVGTTEQRQAEPGSAQASEAEIAYLLNAYNTYFFDKASMADIRETFAGLRPLVKSAANPSQATREYVLERNQRLINVFGGKWTTARALARNVRKLVEKQ